MYVYKSALFSKYKDQRLNYNKIWNLEHKKRII